MNPVGEAGKCVLFRECQPLVDIYNKPVNTPDDTQFLTESRCGLYERKTLVSIDMGWIWSCAVCACVGECVLFLSSSSYIESLLYLGCKLAAEKRTYFY